MSYLEKEEIDMVRVTVEYIYPTSYDNKKSKTNFNPICKQIDMEGVNKVTLYADIFLIVEVDTKGSEIVKKKKFILLILHSTHTHISYLHLLSSSLAFLRPSLNS